MTVSGAVLAVEARQVSLSFGETTALSEISVQIGAGETVALMGPSGSGKSTLLYCLAGILQPDRGSVVTAGLCLTEATEAARGKTRLERMGFVFQFGDLIPELSLRENVALPLQLNGATFRKSQSEAQSLMDRLGIGAVAGRRAGEVSGGEAQRAAVARALVHRPQVVFADEPTGSLDTASGEEVLDLLVGAAEDSGTALVIVTHDHRVAAHVDRLVILRDGAVVSDAGSAE